jgi:predicted DNA-binding transcriptional regulator YafY
MKKIFDAINLLAQPCGATIKDLAKRLETTERQAYRTIETLQDDFYFVITKDQALLGSDVRYYLKEKDQITSFTNMKVADLNLSLTEVIALYFLKGHARLYQGTDIETEINRAFAKLDTFVPDGFEKRLEKVKTLFSPTAQFAKDYSGKEKIIDDLTEAILQQKTCSIEYHSFYDDKVKTFKIDPLRFFEQNGGLYAFIRATSYGDIRVLAVERIQNISILNEVFDQPKDFDPDALLDNAFGIFYDDPITVKVRFPADQARYIQERSWAKDQKITKSKNGSIVLTMNTSGWYDVKRWILSFGPEAELLEPAEMREELKIAAQEMAGLYK